MQRSQDGLVSFECLSELFRQEVEDANDIRLSIVLLRECMGEKEDFCENVVPGACRPPLGLQSGLHTWGCDH